MCPKEIKQNLELCYTSTGRGATTWKSPQQYSGWPLLSVPASDRSSFTLQVADISDVVRQRADALMLSGESAVGAYPEKALGVLRQASTCHVTLHNQMTDLRACCQLPENN